MKEIFIEYVNNNFSLETQKIILDHIETFYNTVDIIKNKYDVGDDVFLKKHTYIHGVPGLKDSFDWIVDSGFISNNFTDKISTNKIKNSIGMWDIQEDCFLKDYINMYSGVTIDYYIGRGPGSKEVAKMIPYHKFDQETEIINDREDVWMYRAEQTKEVRFIPSLVANKRQIAFILNTESEYAKKLIKNDVWTIDLEDSQILEFIDPGYGTRFLDDRKNRNDLTTNRETSIIFGLPPSLIEGVFVGRKVEEDKNFLDYIKSRLPDCYICNLDGKVIVGNK